jgi:RNA polymerase sigma-70 factor (ECF subfamily)
LREASGATVTEAARPSPEEDARLVRRAQGGDREAFERLVRRHLAAAHRVALRRTGDTHDAEDVCQDAFVRALGRIEDCGRPERFRGWLLAVVRNTALNAVDRRKRRRTEPLDGSAAPSDGDDPAARHDRAALRDRLREAMARLPDRQREVLVLHDYEGWTHREIAERLGIAAGTSRYHLHAARAGMRTLLDEARADEEREP